MNMKATRASDWRCAAEHHVDRGGIAIEKSTLAVGPVKCILRHEPVLPLDVPWKLRSEGFKPIDPMGFLISRATDSPHIKLVANTT